MSVFARSINLGTPARVLTWTLTAAMAWPLFPARVGRSVDPPFGMRPRELALVFAVATVAYCVVIARRSRYPAAIARTLVAVVAVATLSLLLGTNIERNGNGYFTADALFEGLAVLLAAHLVTLLLRALATRSEGLTTTAALVTDVALDGIALLMLGFVVLAVLRQHAPAGSLLVIAGVYYVLLILFLAPHAIAGTRPVTYTRPHSHRRTP